MLFLPWGGAETGASTVQVESGWTLEIGRRGELRSQVDTGVHPVSFPDEH